MRTKAINKDRRLSNMLDELEHGLKEIYGNSLRKIFLYGSYAREQSEPGSDLGLMVLCDLDEKDIRIFDEAVIKISMLYQKKETQKQLDNAGQFIDCIEKYI